MACGAASSSSSSSGCGRSSSRSSGGCGASSAAPSGCGAPAPSGCGAPAGGCGQQEAPCPPIPAAAPASAARAARAPKSAIEKALLCAKCPTDVSETATICANGVKGIYVNKSEVDSFNGPIPIEDYEIFNDPNPKVINKVMQGGDQTQEVQVKFLVAPAGAPAGDIIIREKAGSAPGPAPPVIIRQQAAGCGSSQPQCFRECPPAPCPRICPQLIEVCAAGGAPPPRKVIIEKLPAGGAAPAPIYAERWLSAAGSSTRNVVFEAAPAGPGPKNPRNVIINWTRNEGAVSVNATSLGKEETDPEAYVQQYGSQLTSDLPAAVKSVRPPKGTKLAGKAGCDTPRLVGCVAALKNVDLAAHGLSEYASQVARA